MADGTWDSAAPGRALGQGMQQVANATMQAAQMQQQQQMHRDNLNMQAQIAEMRWNKNNESGFSGNPDVQAAKDRAEIAKLSKEFQNLTKDNATKELAYTKQTLLNLQNNPVDGLELNNYKNDLMNSSVSRQNQEAIKQQLGKDGEWSRAVDYNDTLQNTVSKLAQIGTEFSNSIIDSIGFIAEAFQNSPALIKVDPKKITLEKALNYIGSSTLLDEKVVNNPEFKKGIAFLKMLESGQRTGKWGAEDLKNEFVEINTSQGPIKFSVAEALMGPNSQAIDDNNEVISETMRDLDEFEKGFSDGRNKLQDALTAEENKIKEGWDNLFVEDENGVLIDRQFGEDDYTDEYRNLKEQLEDYDQFGEDTRKAYNKYTKEVASETSKLYDMHVDNMINSILHSKDFYETILASQSIYGGVDDKGNWVGAPIYNALKTTALNPRNQHDIDMFFTEKQLEYSKRQNELKQQENIFKQQLLQGVDLDSQAARQYELSTLNADTSVKLANANNIQADSQVIQSDTNRDTAAHINQLKKEYNQAIAEGNYKKAKELEAMIKAHARNDHTLGAGKNTQSVGMVPTDNAAPVQQNIAQPNGGSGKSNAVSPQAENTYKLFQRRIAEAQSIEELANIFNKDLELLNSDKVDPSKIYQVLNERLMALLGIPENERDSFDFVNDPRVASNGAMKSVIQQFNNIAKNSKAMDKNTGLTIAALSHLNSLTSNIEELLSRKDLDGNFLLAAGNTARNLWSEFVNNNAASDASKAQQWMSFLGKGVNKVAPLYFKGNKGQAYEPLKNGKVAISGFNGDIATFQQAVRLQKELVTVGLQEIEALGSYKDDAIMSQVGGIKKNLQRKLIALNHMDAVASLGENIGQVYHGDKNTLEAINYYTNTFVSIGADGKVTEYKLIDPLLANIKQENPKLYNEYMKDRKKLTEQAEYNNKSLLGKGIHNARNFLGW